MNPLANNTGSACLNIVVAFTAEARPFIDYFRLKRCIKHTAFPVYKNSAATIFLIVCGLGKVNAASASSYLFGINAAQTHSCFLNFGLAGSGNYTIGEIYIANKITDATSQKSYYPTTFTLPKLKQAALLTYDTPQKHCQNNALIDMEAAGFFQAANHLVTKEQIQCLKVVSDHGCDQNQLILKTKVIALINQNMAAIDKCIQALLELSAQQATIDNDNHIERFFEHWHFTQYQRNQLKELLRRWQVNLKNQDPLTHCKNLKNSSAVLNKLDTTLQQINYTW